MAFNSSAVKSLWTEDTAGTAPALALFGSRSPTTGMLEASMVWKGVATKWPFSSNHSVKERARVMVWDLPDFGVRVMFRL